MSEKIPQQLAIMDRFVALMEGINPTNQDPRIDGPYTYDLRGNVFLGRTTLGLEAGSNALAFLEAPQPADVKPADNERVEREESWTILLQGFAENDNTNPTRPAYFLKAACEVRLARVVAVNDYGRPLFPEDFLFGKLIQGMTIGQGVVRPPAEKVSKTAFFYIPLVIDVATDVMNPYVEVA